jgi:hypothetical protein
MLLHSTNDFRSISRSSVISWPIHVLMDARTILLLCHTQKSPALAIHKSLIYDTYLCNGIAEYMVHVLILRARADDN